MENKEIIESIEKKLSEAQEALSTLKKKLGSEKIIIPNSNFLYIPSIDKEVEIEVHDKNKSWDDLKQQYGEDFEKQLLTRQECETILKDSEISKLLKMDGSSNDDDFFIQQPFNLNRKNGYIAQFDADSDSVYLYCRVNSYDSGSTLGVRFVRKILKKK